MNIEDQVVSLDLAKKLKGLGVKQDGFFYYADGYLLPSFTPEHVNHNNEGIVHWTSIGSFKIINDLMPAFTVAELLDMMPADIDKCNLFLKKSTPSISMEAQYEAAYPGKNLCGNRDSNPANALAYLLIKLIDYKLVEVKNGN